MISCAPCPLTDGAEHFVFPCPDGVPCVQMDLAKRGVAEWCSPVTCAEEF